MTVGLRVRAREKLREWLLGRSHHSNSPRMDEIVRSPEMRTLYEIDQRLPEDVRPVLAITNRHVLRCYRLVEGKQCGLLLYRKPGGALFCYEHGDTRR